MKKIIPFNNVLEFNTDVKEITAISLEHEIKKYPDMISGVFYISGEYKMTEGLLEREKFDFELPFDIALTNNYDLDSLLVDIDDFRYDLISDKSLKVNIDLYIDGEIIEQPLSRDSYTEELPTIDEFNPTRDLSDDILNSISDNKQEDDNYEEKASKEPIHQETDYKEETIEPIEIPQNTEELPNKYLDTSTDKNIDKNIDEIPTKWSDNHSDNDIYLDNDTISPERINLLKDMLTNNKENNMIEESNININNINNNTNDNENINKNIFIPVEEEEKFVTYRVYKVLDTDTIDSILTKYNVTKEMLSDYNNIENIMPGDKLIIPTNTTNEK